LFAGIEDLMRYYHATLRYPGFKITGKTLMPPNYTAPRSKTAKPAAKTPAPTAKASGTPPVRKPMT
jgi:hypothetical protein